MNSNAQLAVAQKIIGERAARDAPLGALTTYRIGGRAALLVTASEMDDIYIVRDAVVASGLPVLIVGKGSNMLVSDRGFCGIAVVLGEGFSQISFEEQRVRAGASATLPVLARRTAAAGLTGLEWAVGVPGSVGGALCMNAGGHGSEISKTFVACSFVDLNGGPDGLARSADLHFAYRRSSLKPHQVVIWAEFHLRPGSAEESEAQIARIVSWRREHQPGGQNAGSVFTNPDGLSAGAVIEQAGLRGLRKGSASVSLKHANFIQADSGGSADDVWALIKQVQATVLERTGIFLIPEVRAVGFEDNRDRGAA